MSVLPLSERPPFAGWLSTTNTVTRTFLSAGRIPGMINMGGGLPAPQTYPVEQLAVLAREAVASHGPDVLGYSPVEGLPALRDAVAARFSSEALRLERENVLIVAGGLLGLDLVGKVLIEPGQVIAGHYPTYLGAIDAWRPRCPAYRDLVLEDPAFDAKGALAGAQFAYTVPNFSNPTGKLVDMAMRQHLVDAAHGTGVWLVEDDPYGALYFDGPPLPRMIELSARKRPGEPYRGPVVYMGTLSKEIAPGLRIGWVVAAPEMIEALAMARQGTDMCASGITQRIALSALETGLIDGLRPTLIDTYRKRRDALCDAMEAHLARWMTWDKPVGGMFVWATARDPDTDTDRLLDHAMAAGVCIAPSSAFDAHSRDRRSMRINFTLNDETRLAEGAARLARAFEAMNSE